MKWKRRVNCLPTRENRLKMTLSKGKNIECVVPDAKESLSFLLNAYREAKDLSRAFTTILHSKHPTMAGSQSEELSKDEMEKMSKLSAANARIWTKSDRIQ